MLETLSKKQIIIFFIILAFMAFVIFYYIYSTLYSNNFSFQYESNDLIYNTVSQEINSTISISDEKTDNKIIVYVCGAVKESKVISLEENSRICDAIEMAGGLTDDADLTNINLAYILEDGEKIYIPKKGEEISNMDSQITSYINSYSKNNKININKATQTELETIPGIGPSTAKKIIDYRNEHGKFSSIEDIKNVSGIGDAKYENIKSYITVK